jgi:hypothetical protein
VRVCGWDREELLHVFQAHTCVCRVCSLKDNTYAGTFGAAGWGAKASDVLMQGEDEEEEEEAEGGGGSACV